MQSILVSLNLEGKIVKEIGTFAKRLDMTDLEYIRNGILYFNSINKRKHLISQISQHTSILSQNKSSKVLNDLKEKGQKSQFIL